MKKRILAMLLALLMVFSLLPVTALADGETDPAVAAILARIEALPDPESFPTMTKGELQAVLDEAEAIFTLYDALTEEQQGQIDLSPVRAMYEAEDYLGSAPVANPSVTYKYVDENGTEKEVTGGVTVTTVAKDTTAWSGWMYATGTVTISGDVTLGDDVDLILADGASLKITGGITGEGKTLTVYAQTNGSGKLTVERQSAVVIPVPTA